MLTRYFILRRSESLDKLYKMIDNIYWNDSSGLISVINLSTTEGATLNGVWKQRKDMWYMKLNEGEKECHLRLRSAKERVPSKLRQIVFQLKQFSLLYLTTNLCRCLISLDSCQVMH